MSLVSMGRRLFETMQANGDEVAVRMVWRQAHTTRIERLIEAADGGSTCYEAALRGVLAVLEAEAMTE